MPFACKYKLIDTVYLDPRQIMDPLFFDADNNAIKITDSAKPDVIPSKLQIKVESTHSGVNKNYSNYLPDKMEASAHTWTRDYQKPVLMNHNSSGDCMKDASDPIGRVVDYEFKRSVIDTQRHTILLTMDITDKAAIEKFLDGRYQTFSIGAFVDSITCSICNNDIMNDGFCGHHRGRKYEKKYKDDADNEVTVKETCIWTMGNFEYDEISVVNSPADPMAVALDIQVIGDDDATNAVNNSAGQIPDITDSADQSIINVLDSVDEALQGSTADEQDIQMAAPPLVQEEQAFTSGFNTLYDVMSYLRSGRPCTLLPKDQYSKLVEIAESAYIGITADQAVTEALRKQLDAVNSELINTQKALTEAQASIDAHAITHKALVDQNLTLSRLVQSSLIDQLVMIRTLKDAALDSLSVKSELKTLSTKCLYELIRKESQNLRLIHRPVTVENPGLSDSNGSDAENPGGIKPKAMDDNSLIEAGIKFFMNPSAAMAAN